MSEESIGIIDIFELAFIAIVILIAESLRFVGCLLLGRKYRHPTQRILDETQNGAKEER